MRYAILMRYLPVLVFFFFGTQTIVGQEDGKAYECWLDFTPQYYLSEKIEAYGDVGFRTNFIESKWRRIHIRPSARYKYSSKLEFHGGLGAFYSLTDPIENVFEFRPWQGVKLNWPSFKRLRFDNFIRLEERFVTQAESNRFEYSSRFRYRLNGLYRLTQATGADFWSVEGKWESFFPFGRAVDELFRNRIRVTVGLGKNTLAGWTYAFLINYQGSKTGREDELNVDEYIIQFRVKKAIIGKK